MELARYDNLRSTLIELYNTINNRLYGVWVKPTSLMTVDEVRMRPNQTSSDCIADDGFYERPQRREYSLPHIVSLFPNMVDIESELVFDQPNRIIPEIYEAVQEYLFCWVELINEVPDIVYPNIEELKTIEDIARLLFPTYAQIKPYLDYKQDLEESVIRKDMNDRGLLGLVGIIGKHKMGSVQSEEELSFISHLDNIGKFGVYHRMREEINQVNNTVALSTDSLLESFVGGSSHGLQEWNFTGS